MKQFILLVGMIITLPFVVLEAMIKAAMFILYYPLVVLIATVYPLIANTDIIKFAKDWWNYASRWRKGFYTARLYKLWKIDE